MVCMAITLVMFSACATPDQTDTSSDSSDSASVEAPDDETSTQTETSTEASEKRTIGFIMIAGTIEHCRIFDEGVRSVVESHGDEVTTLDGQLDINTLNKCVEDLIAQQVDAIIIEGLDTEAHIAVIKEANEAGIICVQSDNWCKDESITIGQAASDNFQAGYECGLDAVEKLNGSGKVIVLENPASPAAVDRVSGFIKAAQEGGLEIAAQQTALGVEAGSKVTEDLLQAHPDVNLVFANHDPAAMGALAALKSADLAGKVLVYGVDGNQENLEQIKAGLIAGTAAQDPFTMGATSAQFLYSYWNGEEYEKKVSIPCVFINADNVDEFIKTEE